MSARQWIGAAATAEEAVLKGLKKLGLKRDQVDVEVLGEKRSGLFSLFGFVRMEVKLIEKPDVHRDRFERRREEHFRRDGGKRDSRDRSGRRGEPRRDEGRPRDERPRDERPRDQRREPRNDDRGRDRKNPRTQDDRRNEQPRDGRREGPRRDDRRGDRPNGERPRQGGPRENNRRPDRSREPRVESPQDPSRPPRVAPSPETLLNEWKNLLGWEDLSWTVKNDDSGDVTVVFNAASGERLLGGSGSPLGSLEHLLNIVRSHGDRSVPRVFLEVEGRAAPTDRKIIDEAKRAVEEVKRTGQPFRLDPMPSRDRRLVHQTLANHPDVETASEGEGSFRKVVVKPKNRG